MVGVQVLGNNVTIAFCGANSHYELNVFKPVTVAQSNNLVVQHPGPKLGCPTKFISLFLPC